MSSAHSPHLRFKVAPHILEDLGLNLYTTLPRVVVEYVANAYDADSPHARIEMDKPAIDAARKKVKTAHDVEKLEKENSSGSVAPLASRTLPDNLSIVIEDAGHGMSRDDLETKFLIAGRRRRKEEGYSGYTVGGRAIMGRKGLGKLAGFGVAKIVEVISRKRGEAHATRIVLDYDKLIQYRSTDEVEVEEELLAGGGGFAISGTRIILSRLLYDPLKSQLETIESEIADHFALIDSGDFAITINGEQVEEEPRVLAFAWPNPEEPFDKFIEARLPREGGGELVFNYRLRFTAENEALPAARRGVRVYAHKRLAATPSLLQADTNMHGFRMTDYLDGIVHADFIDKEDSDYISTDRQSLRWDAPLLSDMHRFLSDKIKEACYQAQKRRDESAPKIVKEDPFTTDEINKYPYFTNRERGMAIKFAVTLKGACKQGVKDPVYREQLPALIRSLGHGRILTAITRLSEQAVPDLQKVATELTRLMADEFDQFVSSAQGRLKAIQALEKTVMDRKFKEKKDEKAIQKMFETAPWIVDPTYTQFLTADASLGALFKELAKELKIGPFAESGDGVDEDRPDLVSFIGNTTLQRLVIVELKAANVPLESRHLDQLFSYMERAEAWLKDHHSGRIVVHGQLIGSHASSESRAKGVLALRKRIKDAGPDSNWRVRDYSAVLGDTRAAHQEIIALHKVYRVDDDEPEGSSG